MNKNMCTRGYLSPEISIPYRSMTEPPPQQHRRDFQHRRAQSESFPNFPDDLLLDLDLLDSMTIDSSISTGAGDNNNSNTNGAGDNKLVKPSSVQTNAPMMPSHLRSLSVGGDSFANLGFSNSMAIADNGGDGDKSLSGERGLPYRPRHRHSYSMDGSMASSLEADFVLDGVKKAMPPDRLAELALIDPKRAKRILANRQSAARSKERKVRYTGELERKVHTLQTEATTLSAQVTMLQRDITGLTNENKELMLRLQAMEQQARLRDALNDALRDEVQRLKIETGQVPSANGNSFNRGLSQFSSYRQSGQHFAIHPTHQKPQQHMPQTNTNNQNPNQGPPARYSNFNQGS